MTDLEMVTIFLLANGINLELDGKFLFIWKYSRRERKIGSVEVKLTEEQKEREKELAKREYKLSSSGRERTLEYREATEELYNIRRINGKTEIKVLEFKIEFKGLNEALEFLKKFGVCC